MFGTVTQEAGVMGVEVLETRSDKYLKLVGESKEDFPVFEPII